MATQGIQANLFSFLVSKDKNLKGLFDSLSAGDTLKGRVIDVIPAENKAVINFKGYNVISQLPDGASLKKGDIINVMVTGTGDTLTMKLMPNNSGLGIAGQLQTNMTVQAEADFIANLINEMKLPVNEQNIYIGRRLAEMGVPVTKDNITKVNTSLISYMQQKGITPEIASTNIFSAQSGQSALKDAAALFIKMFSGIYKAAQNLSDNSIKSETKIAIKQQAVSDLMAEFNKLAAIIKNNSDLALELNGAAAVLSAKNVSPEVIRTLSASLSGRALTLNDAAKIMTAASGAGKSFKASFMSGEAELNYSFGTLTVKFRNAVDVIASVWPGADKSAVLKLFDGMINNNSIHLNGNNRINLNNALKEIQVSDNVIKELMSFAGESKPTGDAVRRAAQNILEFTALAAKASENPEISSDIKLFSEYLSKFVQRNEINLISSGIKAPSAEQIARITELASEISSPNSLQNNGINEKLSTNQNTGQVISFDSESAIDAITFLISRNMPSDKARIIDVMKSYFGEGNRLNKALNNINNIFEQVVSLNTGNSGIKNQETLIQVFRDLKNVLLSASIDMNGGKIDSLKTENAIKMFNENAGLNIENKLLKMALPELKDIFPELQTTNHNDKSFADYGKNQSTVNSEFSLRENLKSALFRAEHELNEALGQTQDQHSIKTLRSAREAVQEALTSLSAAQLMNQKPSAFNIIYSQLPILFENKMFNGELQVWYKKGSVKEQLNKSEPVNMLFVLNTSNLGTVKVSLTVFKNDVDCVIKTENEQAKQAIMRGKDEFINGINDINFSMKSINVIVENANDEDGSQEAGYINLGKINIQA